MTTPPQAGKQLREIEDWLRLEARDFSRFSNQMQATRTAEYKARGDSDAEYRGLQPEETKQWRFADTIAAMREVESRVAMEQAQPITICKDGRDFVMELATVMGVVDVCADQGTSIHVSELMASMLTRAKEDRERWHSHPSPSRDQVVEECKMIAIEVYDSVRIGDGEYGGGKMNAAKTIANRIESLAKSPPRATGERE